MRGHTLTLTLSLTLSLSLILAICVAAPAMAYQIAGTSTSHPGGNLVRTELTIQASPNPLDTFKMIRLARSMPGEMAPGAAKGAILLLPSLGTTFALYEQREESGAVGSSFAEFFALRGYEVYGYSPRFEGIPAGTCETGVLPCGVMAGWDLQSMVDDVAFIRSQIEAISPGTKVAVGGLSLGGILTVAVANAAPGDYDGIFPWEGMLSSPDPVVQGLNATYCAGWEAQIAGGIFFDGVGNSIFKQVAQHAHLTPEGLTPIPLFPPQLTNRQVLVTLLSVPTPGPVTMPTPGYITLAGDPLAGHFTFASEERLLENVRTFNNYVPTALGRDVSCSLAGLDTTHVADLGNYTGSVLAIGGGRGFGAYMAGQLAELGSTDVTFLLEPAFGHVDHFFHPRHRDFVEMPILAWLEEIF